MFSFKITPISPLKHPPLNNDCGLAYCQLTAFNLSGDYLFLTLQIIFKNNASSTSKNDTLMPGTYLFQQMQNLQHFSVKMRAFLQ